MKCFLWLAASLLPLVSAAEVVMPIDSVEEHVNIRMMPDAKSEIVGRLFQGDSAPLIRSIPEWHEVEIAGGATGYISAEWTIVLDRLPAPVVEPVSGQLTADAKKTAATSETEDVIPESNMPAVVSEKKQNIVKLTPEEALAALADLEPVTFNYKQDDQAKHVGFIAEDAPELIASSDHAELDTTDIVAVLTRVVQLQQLKITELESRLEERN
jgi:hypothetical protein